MENNGLGTALRVLRERRTLSLRELSQLSGVDHAYIHRLEKGEKTSPSPETIMNLLKWLKSDEREGSIVRWLTDHPESPAEIVEYALNNNIDIDKFSTAASIVHRGSSRPSPEVLFERVRRILEED